jgi:hypothetical protein
MNRWWAAAVLVSSNFIPCGCGPKASDDEGGVASVELRLEKALARKPSSIKLRREEQDKGRFGPTDVYYIVLDYGDANDLGYKGLEFEVTHRIRERIGLETDFKVSRVSGAGRVDVLRMAVTPEGDTLGKITDKEPRVKMEVDEEARGKLEAVDNWCWEIRKALVEVLGHKPRPRK